jgi:phospholipase C
MKNSLHTGLFSLVAFALFATACNKQQDIPAIHVQSAAAGRLAITTLPIPDHIVIVIEENHSFSQIFGSVSAPYINSLAKDSSATRFTKSFALTHPSQPNYLDLFSGSDQGVKDDNKPLNAPFTTANLGSQLIAAGRSYKTYSEDLPKTGFNGTTSGAYARKHNPAVNWMGKGSNQIPAGTNQPLTAFPTKFAKLPTVSIVVPNENNDMHNGAISAGDTWLQTHLDDYIQWAKTHNSLFILTFDEDDFIHNNRILTVFCGSMVNKGKDTTRINHYNILRTIEDMYGLPYAGKATNVLPITTCWK